MPFFPNGCRALLDGWRLVKFVWLTYLCEIKDGDKRPSHRTLTPDQRKWIREWTGSPVVVLLDAGKALSWARRIAAAPGTFAGVFGRTRESIAS